jgi:hypothetical protein
MARKPNYFVLGRILTSIEVVGRRLFTDQAGAHSSKTRFSLGEGLPISLNAPVRATFNNRTEKIKLWQKP